MSYAAVPRTPSIAPCLPSEHGAADRGSLTKRELDVIALLIAGLTRKKIAYQLDISHDAVHAHIKRAKQKLGAISVPQMAYMLGRDGIDLTTRSHS